MRACFIIYYFFGIAAVLVFSACSLPSLLSVNSKTPPVSVRLVSAPSFLPPLTVDIPAVKGSHSPKQVRSALAAPTVSQSAPIQPASLPYTAMAPEAASPVQQKYAVLLNTGVEQLPSADLLEKIDPWMGVPYRSGGNSRSGIDCSAFTMLVFEQCCGIRLPRTSKQQYTFCEPTDATVLSSGDLLFYSTRGKGVSHVGIYLGNGKFAHASVSNGVTVSDISDPYYQKRFIEARRIPVASR